MFTSRLLERSRRLRQRLLVCCAAVILFALFIAGCSESDDPADPSDNSTTGSIQVTVKDQYGYGIHNADVMTTPRTSSGPTNILGKFPIEDVDPGNYTVLASLTGYGSGSSACVVEAGAMSYVPVVVMPGVFFDPTVDIVSPSSGTEFSHVDDVTFRATVNDLEDDPEDLDLEWRSSLDGVLNTSPPDTLGVSLFTTGTLSTGVHLIRATVTDNDGFQSSDSISIEIKSFRPDIQFLSPAPPAEYTPGDLITFQARVSDRETNVTSLSVEWSSNLDGILNSDPPGADSLAGFSTSSLTRGLHEIRLEVIDGDANVSVDSVEVVNLLPAAVILAGLQKTYNSISLQWTQSTDPYFDSYEIYRSTSAVGAGTQIHAIYDAGTRTYDDTDIAFGQQYYYWVRVENTDG